jgi:hypothetical protein
MKSKSSSQQPKSSPISRRNLIRGTAAATLVAATSFPSIPAFAGRKNKAVPEDASAFPVLAAWLVFTTSNPQIRALGDKLAGSLGVSADLVKNFASLDSATPLKNPPTTQAELLVSARKLFDDARVFDYPGAQCPLSVKTLKAIADLGQRSPRPR